MQLHPFEYFLSPHAADCLCCSFKPTRHGERALSSERNPHDLVRHLRHPAALQRRVNDRSGASADIDVQVNYSLDPSAAEYLYSEYGKQQTFTQNYISNDLRSVAREQSGRFDTLTMLTNRGEYTKAVQDALAAKWRKIGLTVEQVSVQDVRYGEAITKKYTEAQAAEIDKQKALNEQQVAKTEAETKKIKAQGEADANAVLNESLTDNVLKQHYIDALSNADQLVVVPDGADTLVQTK